jgi:hypothetical protein
MDCNALPQAAIIESPDETRRLYEQLNAADVDPEELEQWLLGQLSEEGEIKIFSAWRAHWETKIDGAKNFQDQMLARTLFTHTLGQVLPVLPARAYTDGIEKEHSRLHKLFAKLIPLVSQFFSASELPEQEQPQIQPHTPVSVARSERKTSQASSAQYVPPSIDVTAERSVNRFAGKSQFSAKRPHSPVADGRPAKVSRLGGLLTRDDLIDDLQELKAALRLEWEELQHVLRTEFKAELHAQRGQLQQETTHLADTALQVGAAVKGLNALSDKEQFHQHLDKLVDAVGQVDAAIRDEAARDDVFKRFADIVTELKTEIIKKLPHSGAQKKHKNEIMGLIESRAGAVQTQNQTLADIVATAQDISRARHTKLAEKLEAITSAQQIVQEQNTTLSDRLDPVSSSLDALQEQVSCLKDGLETRPPPPPPAELPLPGQDGFLAQFTAPPQWQSDQQEYMQALHRAGWLYLNFLRYPDGGCCEDAKA